MQPINRKEYERTNKRNLFSLFLNKCLCLLAKNMIIPSIRNLLYRLMGIKIGNNVFIGMNCYLDDRFPELIKIEDGVIISYGVLIFAHDGSYRKNPEVGSVIIKRNAQIGAGVIILCGVTIGENAIVGAGAVVTKEISDNAVAVGVPAMVIKELK